MKFSIITIAYNSEKTIGRAIQSVLDQVVPPYEYLIIDGNSQDDTVSVAESYRDAFESKGIQYIIKSEPDEGIYDAMNKGIRLSQGDVVGMINSDDWYEVNAIQVMNEVFEANPSLSMAYADLRIHMPNRTMVKRSKMDRFPSSRNWNHPTTFIKRSVYEKLQYRNETIFDDWDLFLRIRKAGYNYQIVSQVLANFSFGGVSNARSLKKTFERIALKNRMFRQNGYSWINIFDSAFIEFGKYILG